MEYGGRKMSGMRQETRERYAEIYRLYLSGKSKKELSIECCCGYSTIDRALREYGGTYGRASFAERKEEILSMYHSGMTYSEIAEKTGFNESTVSRNLRYMVSAADKDRHRRSKKKYKEQVFRAASGEEEPEIIPRRYAEERRQVRKIVIGGKCYQDITDWFM